MADQSIHEGTEEQKKDAFVPKRKMGKKGLILIIGIVIFILAGGGSVLFFAPSLIPEELNFFGVKGNSKETKEVKEAKENKETNPKMHGHIYNMDPFIVNLADTDSPRYLKIKMDVESDEPKVNEEFGKRLPQLRDAILTILSSKAYDDIYDSEGKKRLKEEIILKSNQLLGNFKVKTVYFIEFVVQ